MINVAMIDDNKDFVNSLEVFLNNYPDINLVFKAFSAINVIELIQQHNPDILLLDIVMPNCDGIDVLGLVSQEVKKPAVIIVSNLNTEYTVKRCRDLGATFFLSKPVNFERIIQEIYSVYQVVSKKKLDQNRLLTMFTNLGFDISIMSTKMLIEAVEIANKAPATTNNISQYIYPAVANKFNTNSTNVKANVEKCIKSWWKYNDTPEVRKALSIRGNSIPTPKKIITTLSIYVKSENSFSAF